MRRRLILFLCVSLVTLQASAADWSSGVGYAYDGSGNIRQIGTDFYVYDVAGRLVQADTNGVRRNYEYDGFGNRKICQQPGTDCQWGYKASSSDNRVADVRYTLAGNVEAFAGHTYSYDATNMPVRDKYGDQVLEYIYTANDERIAIYNVNEGSWRWTIRDTSGKVLREFASQNSSSGALGTASWKWVKDYIWRDNLLLATRQIEPGATAPSTYHYHLDHLGTPRRITDDANRIIGVHDYHAFGPEAASSQQNEPSPTPLKYTGHERDILTVEGLDTLDYMHARYYNPALGRFLSVDPTWSSADLARPQSWNRYSYVLNDPIGNTDPDGRVTVPQNPDDLLEKTVGFISMAIATVVLDPGPDFDNAELPKDPAERAKYIEQNLKADRPYQRPSGATTPPQRAEQQGKPCAKCGKDDGGKRVAGHKNALVKEHYETGTIDKNKMRALDAVQPECPTCSAKEGAAMSRSSRAMKKALKELIEKVF